MDKIIKSLPDDKDKCYIDLDRDTNTFQIKEDPYQQEKDEMYQTVFTVEKKFGGLINKEETRNFQKLKSS